MKQRVFVTRTIPKVGLDLIAQAAHIEIWPGELEPPRKVLLEKISKTDGLLCLLTDKIDAEVLMTGEGRLKVVSNYAVGYDNIDLATATRLNIPVGNTAGVLTETTADLAFALLMSAARRIVEGVDNARSGDWKTWSPTALLGRDVHGSVLGILGMGRIGRSVARRAAGFGMKILYNSPSSDHGDQIEGADYVRFEQLIKESDFISVHTPLTDKTLRLLNASAFKAMKKTAILVNTARGAIVDTEALADALTTGEIGYAALDVTMPEPLDASHRLYNLPNCLIVPHLGSASVATRDKMAIMAAENLLAGLRGARLPHCVNPQVYGS